MTEPPAWQGNIASRCARGAAAWAARTGARLYAMLDVGAPAWRAKPWGPTPGLTPLMRAAESHRARAMRSLVREGADVEEITPGGTSALCYAAKFGLLTGVETLLALGADPDKQDADGWTAATWAASRGCDHALRALLKAGAAVDHRDSAGRTPLLRACASWSEGCMDLLFKAGADPSARGHAGEGLASLAPSTRPRAAGLAAWVARVEADAMGAMIPLVASSERARRL